MSHQISTGRGGAAPMELAGGGDTDWTQPASNGGPTNGTAPSDINNNNSSSSGGVGSNGCTLHHNEIMKVVQRAQLQSHSETQSQRQAAGNQMITKIREKNDLGQLVLNVSFASVAAEGAPSEQVHELAEPRMEVSLCIKQRDATGSPQAIHLLSDTCGGQQACQEEASRERQGSTSKRRLVYECIDQFQLSLTAAAAAIDHNKWAQQRPLLPFAPSLFDACFCFNLLDVRLTSGRHMALEKVMATSGNLDHQTGAGESGGPGTRQAFERSWLEKERLTSELRLRLLRELTQTVKPGGKIMIIVFVYECQRNSAEASNAASGDSLTRQSFQFQERGFVAEQPVHCEESVPVQLGDIEARDICCPRCRIETLGRQSKNVHLESAQPFQKPPPVQSAAESPLTADSPRLIETNSKRQDSARFMIKLATGVGSDSRQTRPSYSSSLRQALSGASVDLSESKAAEKLGDAAKRLGRRLSLGGMSLLVRLSGLTNPFPQTNGSGPQKRRPSEEESRNQSGHPSTNSLVQAAGSQQSIDKLAQNQANQVLRREEDHKLLNDDTQEPHLERNNLLSVFEEDEFERRHRQSIAVQSFFTKSIKVQEDEDEQGLTNEDIKMEVDPTRSDSVDRARRRMELALSQPASMESGDLPQKHQGHTNEHEQPSPTCSRGSREISCSSNEDDNDDVDSTTSGWTAPTSGATNASQGLESCEASSAPIERSSSSSSQQQRRFPVSSNQSKQRQQQPNNKLDNSDKIAHISGDNVCSSSHQPNLSLAGRPAMNSSSYFEEASSLLPAGPSSQLHHNGAYPDHNPNSKSPKHRRTRNSSMGAAGEYATAVSTSVARDNNNNNNNNNHLSWFNMMPTTAPATNSSLNNGSSVASGLAEPVRPRLPRLGETAPRVLQQQHQQQQRRAFSDTEAPHRGALNSSESMDIAYGMGPSVGSVERDAKTAAAAAVAASLSLGMARAQLLQAELAASTSGRLIRSAEPTHQNSPAPGSNTTTTTTTTTSGTPDKVPLESGKLVQSSTTTEGPTSSEMSRSNLIRYVGQASGHRYKPLQDEPRPAPVSSSRYQDHEQWSHSNTFNGSNPNSDMSTSGGLGGSGGDGTGGLGGGGGSYATVGKSDTTDKDSSRRTSTLSGISSIYQQEIGLFTQHSLDGPGVHGSSTPANSSGALMGSIPELASSETPQRHPFLPSGSSGDPIMMMNEPPEPPAPSPLADMPGFQDELGTNLQRVAASLRSQLRERFSSTMRPLNAFMMGRSLAGESDETSSIQEEEAEALEFEQQATNEVHNSGHKATPNEQAPSSVSIDEAQLTTDNFTDNFHYPYKPPDAPETSNTGKLTCGLVRAQSKTDNTSPSSPLKSFFRSKSSAAFNAFASSFQQQSSSSTTPTVTTVLTRHLAASGSLASDVFESLKSPGGPAAGSRLSNQASFAEIQLSPNETPGAGTSTAGGRSPLSPLSMTSTRFFSKIRDKFSLPNNSAARQTASALVREEEDTMSLDEVPVEQKQQPTEQRSRQAPLELLQPPIWEDLLYGTQAREFESPSKRHLLPPVLEQQHLPVSPSNNQEWTEVSQMSMESSCSGRSLHSCWFSMPELHALSYESILNPPKNKKPQGLDLFMNFQVSGSGSHAGQQQQELAGEWPANELYKQIVEGGETAHDWSLSDLNLTSEDIAPRVANHAPPMAGPLIPTAPLQVSAQQRPQVPPAIQQQQQFQHQKTMNLTKGGTLDDSVCASMHSSPSIDGKPPNNNNSRPESQNSTLSNASGALSELNSSGTHSPVSGSPLPGRPSSQPLANEEAGCSSPANRDFQQQQLLMAEPASGSKPRAMSLVPGYGMPTSSQQQAGAHLLATPQTEATTSNRRRSTNACFAGSGQPLDPNVAPAAASLKLRLAGRNNRVKLTDLHPITFINDHQFLSSMSSLKRADNAKLNAIFNSPVARRLSINAAEQSSATAALGSTRASIKIGLTGYVYIEPAKPEAANWKPERRPSLAPDFWRTQAQEAAASSLLEAGAPKRQRAASCAPIGLYPTSSSPQPEAATNTGPPLALSGITAGSHKPVEAERDSKSSTGDQDVRAGAPPPPPPPPLAASSHPNYEQTKRSGRTPRSGGAGGSSSSSSDDGDLDKLIAQYDRPTSVAGPQTDLHNDQLLRQMLLLACDQSSSTSVMGPRHHPHQPAPSRRRYSAINLYQRDEDMFVANSMRWPATGGPPPIGLGKTLAARDVITTLAPLTRPPNSSKSASPIRPGERQHQLGFQQHKQQLQQHQRARLPVMEAITVSSGGAVCSGGHHYPVRSIISGSSGRPMAALTRMGSSISSALVAGVDVEEQLNRLRQQERRSLSGSAVAGAHGGGPPWSSSEASMGPHQQPLPQVSQQMQEQLAASTSASSTPQTDLAGIMSSLILSGPHKNVAGCKDSSMLDEVCALEETTEEEGEVEEAEVEEEEEEEENENERDVLEITCEQLKPVTPNRPRLPDIQEAQVVACSTSTSLLTSRFLSPLATQSASRSPPHSPLSLMASSGPITSSPCLAYSASKSCEPFKQLDTIIEGRGLLLGAEQQADPNYANMLRRLSGNHSRRSSISSVSVTVDEPPSSDIWCRCEVSPSRRRSTLTRTEPPPAKLSVAAPSCVPHLPPSLSKTSSSIETEANKPVSNLLGSAGPRSMFSHVRNLAQRTFSNLAPRIVAVGQRATVSENFTKEADKRQKSSELHDKVSGECPENEDNDDAASSVTGSADHSSMLSSEEEEEECEHQKRVGSSARRIPNPPEVDHLHSSSSIYSNSSSDTSLSHSLAQDDAAARFPESPKTTAGSPRRVSTDKLPEREDEHSMVCHRCNRKIRIGRPEEFADYQGELEDEEMGLEEEEEVERHRAYDAELEDEEEKADEDDEDEEEDNEDDEEEEYDEEEEMELEEEEFEGGGEDETGFLNQEKNQSGAQRGRRPGKRRRRKARADGSTEVAANGETGEAGKLYLAVPPRRKYKWHIKRNLAPKLKRQRSFSANYAPEVPITLIPPPRRFSAAPTLTCPHRNKSSSHSSSSLHHTYSIDSSESMITVIPSNRNHEFMRGTSRSSLSYTDAGSLYMLPKSPLSPRSPSRCSPAGLLTPNTSEHPPLSPVSPAGSSAMRLVNSHGSLADIASGRRQSQPELGATSIASASHLLDQDRFKTNPTNLVANKAAPANLLSHALHELSFQQHQHNPTQATDFVEPDSNISPVNNPNTSRIADPNSDQIIVTQTINEFCHKHSKLELESLIQQLGYLKISESYFSEKSSTLCIVIEVKEE